MRLTIGSLFSGIGGLELGLEWAGLGPVLWQVEKDPFCRRVLAKHWPTVTRFDDVSAVRSYPHVDLVCGGFPCQDVSSAGKGAGLQGARSGLWWEFARIVSEVRPRFVVVENVASGARRWLCAVRTHLHQLGYRTRAVSLSAADVGAPHLRKRIFVVADAHRQSKHARAVDAEVAGASAPSDIAGLAPGGFAGQDRAQAASNAHPPRREGAGSGAHEGWCGPSADPWRSPVSGLVPLVHGLPGGLAGRRRRAGIRALGNAVVPQCAKVIGRIVREMAAPPLPPFCTRPDCCAANRHVEACEVMVQLRAYLKEIRSKR